MKNALRVTVLSLFVVATLAGCFKAKIDVTLNSDDTIDGTMVVAVQQGIGESLGSSDEEILEQLGGDVPGELGDATVEDYNEEGWIGKAYTFTGRPLDTFSSGESGDDISITRDGDVFIVDGTWSTEDTDTEGMDPGALGAEFTFSVTFPGEVTDHNGELSEDGRTVTWNLFDGPETLHAEGKAVAGSSFPVWILLVLVGLLIVAAIVITAIVVRKRAAATAAGTAPAVVSPAAPAVEFASEPASPPVPVTPAEPAGFAEPETPAEPEAPADEQPK